MSSAVPIAFDVLGTCFSFDGCREALVGVFPTLSSEHAQSVVEDWFHAAQRDFTYLSMNGAYTPIAQVLKATLPRIYLMHGLVPSSSASSPLSSSLTDPVISRIPALDARPGLAAASSLLLSHGFRLLAATNGGLDTTKGLFARALGDDEAQRWEYFSCDEDKTAKPAPGVYRDVWKRLGVDEGDEKKHGWFVASHTWDLFAAKKAGFKTAFVTYEEHLTLPSLFGEPDVIASTLEDAAQQIISRKAGRAQ
ncbi:hypothetical protein JCM8208_007745 [Rhodotorula glutinis]